MSAQKMIREGVSKGFPDLLVFLPGKLLAIEMKRLSGSKTSDDQKRWIKTLNGYGYIESTVCKGADAAIEFIKENM